MAALTRIPHTWIDLPDGERLGAGLWLPNGLAGTPVPAVLEYIPYRKDDGTVGRDATLHPHLASHGYACVRVDMRGSGSSDGVAHDEYSEQEMADGERVLEWIAKQPWCDGSVGMIGISWGGITGLQMASRGAPELGAVVALGSTDHRYYDDGGYYVGCMIGETVGWAALMLGYNTRPPDPFHYGDGWRELWLQRLDESTMFLDTFLRHQRDDDYWQRGTVASDYAAIQTPIMAVSGHADCWPNTVSRLLANLDGPRAGIQGAWCHRYPQMALPGPAIDFLPEVVRWFDHWLKNEQSGLEDQPMYRVFLQDGVAPATFYEERPGQWLGFETWPSPYVSDQELWLGDQSLTPERGPAQPVDICSPQTVGQSSGEYMPWFNFGPGDELPDNQQEEDAASLIFDTPPLENELSIVGNASLSASVASDATQALLAVRLCDVAPDGASTLITRGILNLSQRKSKLHPEGLVPGTYESVSVELDHVGYRVPIGHRLRVALSTTYWPMAWPAPTPVTLTIDPANSSLHLPVWDGTAHQPVVEFDPAPASPEAPTESIAPHHEARRRWIDEATGMRYFEIATNNGHTRFTETDLQVDSESIQRFSIHPDDPLTATAHYHFRWRGRRDNWDVETTATTTMTCTESTFDVSARTTGAEDGVIVRSREWDESYPRDHF